MASAAPLARASRPGSPAPERRTYQPSPARIRSPASPCLDPADLETRLVALARSGAPLRRALARLAGRMDRLRGWERIGCARSRDYATERLGISGRQLQELCHVDRAFGGLEAVERAFVSGQISWTKARLVARVARAEDADGWIAHAARVTARELSREVRAVDARARDALRPETDEAGGSEGEVRETVFVRCTPAVRAKWHRARFLASRLHPVPAWKVAESLAAEALSAIPLDAAALERIELEEGWDRVGFAWQAEASEEAASPAPPAAGRVGDPGLECSNGCAPHGLGAELGSPALAGAAAAAGTSNGCAHRGSGAELVSPALAEAAAAAGTSNGCAHHGSGAELGTPALAGAASATGTSNGCAGHGLGTGAATAKVIGAGPSETTAPHGCAPEVPLLASLLEGLDEADAFELDARLRRALAAEQRRQAEMGPYLLAVARGRRYRAYGCSSLGEFAREWLGISPSQAEALLRLERAGQIAPALREAYGAGRLSWARAQELVPLVRREDAGPWHAAWVAHAEKVSVRRLGDEVARALALGEYEPPPLERPGGSWDETGDLDDGDGAEDGGSEDPQTGAHPTTFPKSMAFFFSAPHSVARLFRGALATLQRRIERRNGRTASESEALEAMLEHAFETWGLAHAELQRAHRVFARDGWRCTVPGCTSYGNLQEHHIAYRSHGGSDAPWNRTSLCVWHHQRGEHAKLLRVRGRAPGKLRFELGLRPGRPPLARYRSGDVLAS